MQPKQFVQFGLAAAVLAAFLPATTCLSAPRKNAKYDVLEDTMVFTKPGTWFYGVLDKKLYIRGVEMTAEDHATDERLTGKVTLNFDTIWEGPKQLGPIWSYVKVENHHGNPRQNGWWEGYCFGARELMADGENVLSWFEGTAEGRGIHQGLIARYWYRGTNVMDNFILTGHGYVVERGAPLRPLKVRASRTDRGRVVPGIYLKPFSDEPIDGTLKTLMYWWIENAEANNTHTGKATDEGFGIFDPVSGTGSGMGHCRAANGDMLYWLVAAQTLPDASTRAVVDFAGGTGRFDAAVGGFESMFKQQLTQPDPSDEMLVEMQFKYKASGWIRY